MADYRETLNLPVTPFPMHADLLSRQEEFLTKWAAMDVHRSLLEERRDAPPFIIHDGPPYAAGQIHVGIGMNKVLKDVIAKYQSMNDRRVPFLPGWDCHGLPIEHAVLRELGPKAAELSTGDLRRLCADHALRYVGEQRRLFQRLGIFADWSHPYLTLSPAYEAGVLGVLLDMVEAGYVRSDVRPISWCGSCRTSLAEAEIEITRARLPSYWIPFHGDADLRSRLAIDADLPIALIAWVTALWALPAGSAIGVGAAHAYSAYRYRDGEGLDRIVVLNSGLAGPALAAMGLSGATLVGRAAGRDLVGTTVLHPLGRQPLPLVASPACRGDLGSGFLLVSPAASLDDFLLTVDGRRLEMYDLIDERGRFAADAGAPVAGLDVPGAEAAILEELRRRSPPAAVSEVEQDLPSCWRCGGRLITRPTRHWIVSLDHRPHPDQPTLRQRSLLEIDVTRWLPASSRERIRTMVQARPDWCISRPRLWGVPIPAFHCLGCHQLLLVPEVIRHVRDLIAEFGSEIWFERDAGELLPPGYACPGCRGTEFEKDRHILDVWFESGASFQSVLVTDHRLAFPADLCVEGSDQHRGWFQLSLLQSVVSRGKAPFRAVMTHGFVLNEQRRRMDRSKGDLVTLQEALERVPADVLRLFFCSVDAADDVPFSFEALRPAEGTYRSIRNTFRFLLGSLHDFAPRDHAVHLDDLRPLDLWLLCRLHRMISEVTSAFAGYRFHVAVRRLVEFCGEDLSRTAFEALKDRLYCEAPASPARRSAQTALHSVLMALVKLLAPILPYTCEEVFLLAPGRSDCASVHLSRWPRSDSDLLQRQRSRTVDDAYARLLALRRTLGPALEALRTTKEIGENSDAVIHLHSERDGDPVLDHLSLEDLREFLMVAEVKVAASADDLALVQEEVGLHCGVTVASSTPCARCRRRDRTCDHAPAGLPLCSRCLGVLARHRDLPAPPSAPATSVSVDTRPAEIAAFLRRRGVRKAALLAEDGVIRPFALHPSSQEVRLFHELQPLADHINASPDFRRHSAVLLGLGQHTDVLFGIGLHHLSHGTPLGGTREFAYPRIRDMLDNLLRLSWGMSVKNAIAELPHGGGKSIIDTCGWDLKVHREFRREIYRDFGQFTASLFGRYICAEDVGNTNADTREMLSTCRHVMCLSQGVGGSGNPSRFTAFAAWAAAKAGWKFLTGTTSFAGLRIALQGAGNVGHNLVDILVEGDPDIAAIVVADRSPDQLQMVRSRLRRRGREGLLQVVSSGDPLDGGRGGAAYVERDDERNRDYVLYTPCDILVPAAVGNVISLANVDRLKCRLIVPISNNVYSDNDAVAAALQTRGIIDVVENNVNWGGALAAASELLGYDEDNVAAACAGAFRKTLDLLEEARAEACPPWQILKRTAGRRVFEEVHPIVAQARRYPFIGDIARDFAGWVKNKWLRGVVDVESDQFAAYAVGKARSIIEG